MSGLFAGKIAFRNILRNPRRSFATGLAVTAGYIGIVLLGAYIVRVKNGLEGVSVYAHLRGHIYVAQKDSLDYFPVEPQRYQISKEHLEKIMPILNQDDRVEYVGKFLGGSGLISNGERSVPFVGLGFEPAIFKRAYHNAFLQEWAGDWILASVSDFPPAFYEGSEQGMISITRAMGELLGVSPQSSAEKRELQIAGRNFLGDLNAANASAEAFHSTGSSMSEDTSLLAPLKTFQDLYATEGVQYISIFLKDRTKIASTLKDLKAKFAGQNLDLELLPFTDQRVSPFYAGTMSILYIIGGFFIVLICGTVVSSVMNSIAINLIERTRELGTLRAMGYDRIFMQTLLALEIAILSLGSVVLGAILAAIIAWIVNSMNIRFSPAGISGDIQFVLGMQPGWCIAVGLILIVLSVITSFFVVAQKIKLDIINLLQDGGA